ncbi:hypothetical protein IU433_12155 [Nocardia puris]|uniref:hypothetical protein n=1 Tax=Nocardia puris TaxID=208602 RepID=UPI00189331A9|nr:hypothetical protein [Nocardia puris]MBF6459789.1 hypothetical protein [Nocardia puris]
MSSVLIAGIWAIVHRGVRRADYAEKLIKQATEIAERSDERTEKLERKIDVLEAEIETLTTRLADLGDLLRSAIPLLQAAGYPDEAARMRAALTYRGA